MTARPVLADLLVYRSRWYAIETRRLVSRHWQWFAMALLALSAGPMVVLMISAPALSIFAGLHGVLWNFIALTALLVIALLWSGVQRVGITGGPFGIYLRSLPLRVWPRLWVDTAILLIADSLLFLPLAISALYVSAFYLPDATNWARCAAVIATLVVILIAQRTALTRLLAGLAAGVVACAVLAAGLAQPVPMTLGIAAAVAVAVAVGLSLMAKPAMTLRQYRLRRFTSLMLPPAWQIEADALFHARLWPTLLRLTVGFAIGVFTLWLLARSGFDARSRFIGACALAMNAIVFSGIHRSLDAIHAPARSYTSSLPLARNYWPLRDTVAAVVVSIAPAFLILYGIAAAGALGVAAAFGIGVAYLALVAVLRFPQLHGGQHATIFSALIAALWTAAVCLA